MKTTIPLKEFSAVSPSAVQITHATAPGSRDSSPPAPTKNSDLGKDFREMQHRRHITPFESAIPCHRFGINE